ncbi:EAL domain-containing protein, partial [Dermatophilus congolensis]
LQNLARLRRAGINVVIDDFGTGHSSFTSLLRTPANGVKLDPSLISRIGHDPRGATQVRAMIRLVQALKLDTAIAEGVETAEQATVLEEAGCHMAQGNYFAIPQSPTDILTQATPTIAE